MSRELFIPQDSETFEHSSWPCPVASGTFESQVLAHFWGGEVELWRHELAFPTSYGTKSPRVRFSASQPKEAFFRSLASFTWLFWYNVTRQTSKKFYCPARLWLWIEVGKELATRNRDPKGQENSRQERVWLRSVSSAGGKQTDTRHLCCPYAWPPSSTKQERFAPSAQIAVWDAT